MKVIDIKPLSTNALYNGRRWKTEDYRQYEAIIRLKLRNTKLVLNEKCQIFLYLEMGVSSKGADLTNTVKGFEDIISKIFKFNDNRVYQSYLKKVIVPKGAEYIKFDILDESKVNIKIEYL